MWSHQVAVFRANFQEENIRMRLISDVRHHHLRSFASDSFLFYVLKVRQHACPVLRIEARTPSPAPPPQPHDPLTLPLPTSLLCGSSTVDSMAMVAAECWTWSILEASLWLVLLLLSGNTDDEGEGNRHNVGPVSLVAVHIPGGVVQLQLDMEHMMI